MTSIEWTDATWNPVAGCTVLTSGCTNCYAMAMAHRLEAMGHAKYAGLTRLSGGRPVWTGEVRPDPGSLGIPLRWRRPRRVFVNSMSDLFHPCVEVDFIRRVWQVQEAASAHVFQILTKRPDRMAEILGGEGFPVLDNVWLGTSVEESGTLYRLDILRRVPAAVRFVSFEPLLGSVGQPDLSGIGWAIVGGESGRGARPMREAWVSDIEESCCVHDAAFFFKQWGAWGADGKRRSKKANGRLFRGRIRDGMPAHGNQADGNGMKPDGIRMDRVADDGQ